MRGIEKWTPALAEKALQDAVGGDEGVGGCGDTPPVELSAPAQDQGRGQQKKAARATVLRAFANPVIVLGVVDGQVVRIRKPAHRVFRAGQPIEVAFVQAPDLWQFAGLPR